MKCRWIWAGLLGLVVGMVGGFCLSLRLLSPLPEPKQAPVLETFDFHKATQEAGSDSWEVISEGEPWREGNSYYLGPWKGESWGNTRQIVAQIEMSQREQRDFAGEFRNLLREAYESQGAHSVEGLGRSSWSLAEERLVQRSRYQYYLGGMRGAIEFVMVGRGEQVTLLLTFAEVRATAESWPLGDIPLFRRSSGMP